MFRNYLKIAWRNLLKQKLYSFINIGGLAIGLTCFILIFLYVQHELSYDRFYKNANQIYRIYLKLEGDTFLGSDRFASTPAALASTLKEELPEVATATTINEQTALLAFDDDRYFEEGIEADAQFFEVFSIPFIQGDPQTALTDPKSIVLTRSFAQKIFGEQDPLNKILTYQNEIPFTVTGVVEDLPANSSFNFSYLTSIVSNQQYLNETKKGQWDNNSFHTFFKLTGNASPNQLEQKLLNIHDKYVDYGENLPFEDFYRVQALEDLHLEDKINFDIGSKGNPKYVSLFLIIALIVLLLACINYMNLAIARSIKRATEVGLRKAIGVKRSQLIGQFIGESIFISFLALLIALGLTYLLLPFLSHWFERPLELNFIDNKLLFPGLLILMIFVGIITGSYPAFLMSSLRPVQVIKGKIEGRFSGSKVRYWLVVGQYVTSIVLIISSLMIYQQFEFIQDKELGYHKEHVITIPVRDDGLRKDFEILKSSWLSHPGIAGVTTSNALPTNVTSATLIDGKDENFHLKDLKIYDMRVDHDFLDLYEIDLIAGRNFSLDIKSDQHEGYIINETAAKAFGWTPHEALGKQFTYEGTKTVIGVVEDFHMHSMHMAIEPLMIRLKSQYFEYISVKVSPEDLTGTLDFLASSFKQYSPYPFEYKFLDEQFDLLYKSELKLGETFGFFTILSILIASMGLFGLAAFEAEQRTKEIGIRKVLGATVQSIEGILAKDFLTMVLVGFAIAIPISWYAMHQWLHEFAYRIEIEWWVFAIAGLITALIALLTVSWQSWKAATRNPVEALKYE